MSVVKQTEEYNKYSEEVGIRELHEIYQVVMCIIDAICFSASCMRVLALITTAMLSSAMCTGSGHMQAMSTPVSSARKLLQMVPGTQL